MSCMKKSVCTEPSVEIVDPKDEISSRCTVKVMGKRLTEILIDDEKIKKNVVLPRRAIASGTHAIELSI